MSGGVSHLDTFDPKPALEKYAGQPLSGKGEIVVRQGNPGPLMPSPFHVQEVRADAASMSRRSSRPLRSTWTIWRSLRSVYGKSNDHVQAHL